MSDSKPVIAVIGGTGDLGTGLVYRWCRAGYHVIIGSRKADSAAEAATAMQARVPGAHVEGMENPAAASKADIVCMTVPFSHQQGTLESIRDAVQGKIFIDVTVSLKPPKVGTVQLPAEGSAGVIAQQTLGDQVRVVSAFQNIAAAHLNDEHDIHCDVLVTGDDADARETVVQLAQAAGMKAWHAGSIANSAATEALTSVLIFMNKRYKIAGGAGIAITGEPGV
ncbi:MAG: NADPH-dependent F420 reductase [Pseudomonadales bacterium]|nr:NADPH-dependent F420 reductase [Pseudomonadales bacterium]